MKRLAHEINHILHNYKNIYTQVIEPCAQYLLWGVSVHGVGSVEISNVKRCYSYLGKFSLIINPFSNM